MNGSKSYNTMSTKIAMPEISLHTHTHTHTHTHAEISFRKSACSGRGVRSERRFKAHEKISAEDFLQDLEVFTARKRAKILL
jgi:hypothetical protein